MRLWNFPLLLPLFSLLLLNPSPSLATANPSLHQVLPIPLLTNSRPLETVCGQGVQLIEIPLDVPEGFYQLSYSGSLYCADNLTTDTTHYTFGPTLLLNTLGGNPTNIPPKPIATASLSYPPLNHSFFSTSVVVHLNRLEPMSLLLQISDLNDIGEIPAETPLCPVPCTDPDDVHNIILISADPPFEKRLENEVTAWERFQLVLVGGGWGLLLLWMIMSRCGEEWKKIKEPEGTVYEEYLVERDYQERETYVHSS